jgi:hypothetical protein
VLDLGDGIVAGVLVLNTEEVAVGQVLAAAVTETSDAS